MLAAMLQGRRAAASVSTPRRTSSRSASASAWTARPIAEDAVVDGVEALGTLIARLDATMFEATTALALDHFAREARGRRGARGRPRRPPRRDHGRAPGGDRAHAASTSTTRSASATPSTAIAGEKAAHHPRGHRRSPRRRRRGGGASSSSTPPAAGVPLLLEGRDLTVTLRARSLDGQRIDCAGPDWRLDDLDLGLLGTYQPGNALLAVTAARVLGAGDARDSRGARARAVAGPLRGAPATAAAGSCSTAPTTRPARARSPSRCAAYFGDTPMTLVLGVLRDKDAAGILGAARARCARRVVLTAPANPRAAAPERSPRARARRGRRSTVAASVGRGARPGRGAPPSRPSCVSPARCRSSATPCARSPEAINLARSKSRLIAWTLFCDEGLSATLEHGTAPSLCVLVAALLRDRPRCPRTSAPRLAPVPVVGAHRGRRRLGRRRPARGDRPRPSAGGDRQRRDHARRGSADGRSGRDQPRHGRRRRPGARGLLRRRGPAHRPAHRLQPQDRHRRRLRGRGARRRPTTGSAASGWTGWARASTGSSAACSRPARTIRRRGRSSFGSATADLEDFVYGTNASFWVKNIPLIPFVPFFAAAIRRERQTGFLFPKVGSSSRQGLLRRDPVLLGDLRQPGPHRSRRSSYTNAGLRLQRRLPLRALGTSSGAASAASCCRRRERNDATAGLRQPHARLGDRPRPLASRPTSTSSPTTRCWTTTATGCSSAARSAWSRTSSSRSAWESWNFVGNVFCYQDLTTAAADRAAAAARLSASRACGSPSPACPASCARWTPSYVNFVRDVGSNGARGWTCTRACRGRSRSARPVHGHAVRGRPAHRPTTRPSSGIARQPRRRRARRGDRGRGARCGGLLEAGADVETQFSRVYRRAARGASTPCCTRIEPLVNYTWITGKDQDRLPLWTEASTASPTRARSRTR